MTRKEFIARKHPNSIDGWASGGVKQCPAYYADLVEIDPSAKSCYIVACHGCDDEKCSACWNKEIPGTKKTRPHGFRLEKKEVTSKKDLCECDFCKNRDLCKFESDFRSLTKEMDKHCTDEIAKYNLNGLGIQLIHLHCKRFESSASDDIARMEVEARQTMMSQEVLDLIKEVFHNG